MSTSDGNSTTRPLRRRQSKRFDRRGGSPLMTGSSIVEADDDDVEADDHDVEADDHDVEIDVPEPGNDLSDLEAPAVTTATDHEETPEPESKTDVVAGEQYPGTADDLADAIEPAVTATMAPPSVSTTAVQSRRPDPTGRNRTLDQMSPCGRCGHDVSIVHIEVDGNILMMESCDNCDTRRWQLAGEPIELQQALDHVGEHTGRRR